MILYVGERKHQN